MDVYHPFCWWCGKDIKNVSDTKKALLMCTTPLLEDIEACLCEECKRDVLFPVRCYFLLPERQEEEYKLFRSLTDQERIKYVKENNLIEKGEIQAEQYFNKFKGETKTE